MCTHHLAQVSLWSLRHFTKINLACVLVLNFLIHYLKETLKIVIYLLGLNSHVHLGMRDNQSALPCAPARAPALLSRSQDDPHPSLS